jgi:hypothetical protein
MLSSFAFYSSKLTVRWFCARTVPASPDWHVDFCFDPEYMGLSDEAAKNCADSCHTECLNYTEGSIAIAGLEVEYGDSQNTPMYETVIRNVSGPLVDCQSGGPGECTANTAQGFVCLVSCCEHKFSDNVINCEEAGGIGVIMYSDQEDGSITEGNVGDAPLEISMTSISMQDGLYLQANATGQETALSVRHLRNECKTGCSDRIPCNGPGYCGYELGKGAYGLCNECVEDEDEQRIRVRCRNPMCLPLVSIVSCPTGRGSHRSAGTDGRRWRPQPLLATVDFATLHLVKSATYD